VAITLALLLMASQIASNKMVVTREGWRETLGSWEEIMARFPTAGANAAALELEGLSAALGIDLATRSAEGRQRPTKEDARAHHRVKKQIGKYLEPQLERPSRGVESPPEELAAYLSEYAGELDAVRRELLGGELPRWEMELERLWEATIPNLLGHIDLQKLLCVDALARLAEGDRAGAIADLEASWRLNTALRDRPVMITQLVAINIARMRAGTLRHVEDVPAVWIERLSEHDFRASLFDALLVESWLWSQIDDGAVLDQGDNPWARLLWSVATPYTRFCIADISEKYRRAVQQLSRRKTLCDYDLAAGKSTLDVPIPKWNLMAKIIMPNLGGVVDRVARLELDLELTEKVLHLEEARREGGGRWPYAMPGIESSPVCPRDNWTYSFELDGSMSIVFSRDISWPDHIGVILPTRFSAGP
jgi:hypothetical protein